MKKQHFTWTVGYSKISTEMPDKMFPATVPGAAQLDYAKANDWKFYGSELNYQQYHWMEDVFWIYETKFCFELEPEQAAQIVFRGIDYQYTILLDEHVLTSGEGMFTPVILDVTKYAGAEHTLRVKIAPVPKEDDSDSRTQANHSCKPAASYGWDWHPRLVSVGIWDDAYLQIGHQTHLQAMELSYQLNDTLEECTMKIHLETTAGDCVRVQVLDKEKQVVAEKKEKLLSKKQVMTLLISHPKLWNPVGYGEQNTYTVVAELLDADCHVADSKTRSVGFRRVRLVMNEGSWSEPKSFPKTRSDAPATLEINGRRIFAKGSNWVNAGVFPGALREEDYHKLLTLVKDANMNILRIWGGGFVNHEEFFELCDAMGIMVWQEFPLACNEYPDEENYLRVLEQEAISIVHRLRTHPSVVLWCGGNELFNNWSGMTEQHHALRLLDKVCYDEDRFTPFIMTSPLNGMAHGHYHNLDTGTYQEFLTMLIHSHNTAYTEFGSPSAASPEYIRKYISSEESFQDCTSTNPEWVAHHAFLAWEPESWLREIEADYYYGGYSDVDDLCNKTQKIQAMCYRSYFEEMRRQWPHCAMALNWCFNEPWPTFANNSLVSWPDIPKPAYYAVQKALRTRLASIRVEHHLWKTGENFNGEIWLLNDGLEALSHLTVSVSYQIGSGETVHWGELDCTELPAQTNHLCGNICIWIPETDESEIHIYLSVKEHPEMDSEYEYPCRKEIKEPVGKMLNR